MPLFLLVAAILGLVEGLVTRGRAATNVGDGASNNEAYTFDAFLQYFGQSYEVGSEEYARRAGIFQNSLSQIRAKNSRGLRSWTAGLHPFMDWTDDERTSRLHGYVPSLARRSAAPAHLAAVQISAGASSVSQIYGQGSDSFVNPAPPVRNQGACGSCWAIASVEALEAQLMKTNASMFQHKGSRLSPQALLNCVQNPRHCGGEGGCAGATPQLAFDYIQNNGLPLDVDVPYQQADDKCKLNPYPSNWARVTISGWRALPSNQAQPLMQAMVELGAVVVSVSAQNWYYYKFGIYDECEKDSIPNHSVLARGYGAEDQVGKYWLLQNSWGDKWGEQGAIRILRHDDEDNWCGNDSDPQEGSACEGDSHQNVTVCGSCAILYDAVIPHVDRIVFPEHAATRDFHDAAADSSANLMLSAYASVSRTQRSGDHTPADETLGTRTRKHTLADETSDKESAVGADNSFMKAWGLVTQPSVDAGTAPSDIDAVGVVPSAQEFRSDRAKDDLIWTPSQVATSVQPKADSPWAWLDKKLISHEKTVSDVRIDVSMGDAGSSPSFRSAADSAAAHGPSPNPNFAVAVSEPEAKAASSSTFDSPYMHVHDAIQIDALDAYQHQR